MKTVTLPLEFVKEAYKAACNDWKKRIEEHVPELAKETGWYWWENNLVYYNNGEVTYGFWDGKWIDNLMFSFTLGKIPATDKEVEDALIKEAKKRGFKNGGLESNLKYKPIFSEHNSSNTAKHGSNFEFVGGELHNIGRGRYCIFKDGKWAEIIVNPIPKSLQKAIDKLGKEKILEYLK